MKLEVLSTITVDTTHYQMTDEGSFEKLEDKVLMFSFRTRDLALIIFRGGPEELIVDDKVMRFKDGGVQLQIQGLTSWLVVKDAKKFYSDCIEAYVKARNFEIDCFHSPRFREVTNEQRT